MNIRKKINLMKKINSEDHEKLVRRGLYFTLPFITMLIVFMILRMAPFGYSSVMWWDMGEQYIVFFSFYRNTLLHHPSQLLYSFTDGIGGETVGLWAYYLLSPFNLILLFFSRSALPIGILLLTLIKYGCAGFAFGYFLEKLNWINQKWIPVATVCYSVMGWIIANQLNIMWLDVLIFMPFILLGIEKIFDENKSFYYTVFLALLLFVNFYMGYMVCIFAVLYFAWTATRKWNGWKDLGKKFSRFGISSILAAGSVSFLLLPTFFDITKSKGVYTQKSIQAVFEYAPWKMLTKFMVGSLNDNAIQGGPPNLFVGALILSGFIIYFLAKKIPWKEKISAGIVSAIMILAMCWQPLDIMWHAFQGPVDYPYRFSFIVSAWMILLAVRGLTKIGKPKIYQLLISFIIPIGCWVFVFIKHKKFDYLTVPNMITTLIFMLLIDAILVWVLFGREKTIKKIQLQSVAGFFLLLLTVVECGINGYQSVKTLGFAPANTYTDFVANLDPDIAWIKAQEKPDDFYRIGKTFQRSENDSLSAGYRGMSGFTSTQNAAVTKFMGAMGQPNYLGKEDYIEGTLLTDSVMGVKYFLAPNNQFSNLASSNAMTPASSYRPDISFYDSVKKLNGVTIYQNPLALSIGFAADNKVLSSSDFPSGDYTADDQSYLLNRITGTNEKFFETLGYHVIMRNCSLVGGVNGTLVTTDKDKPSSYEIILKNISAEPYYLQLTTDIIWNANVTINGNTIPGFENGGQPVLVNVCANDPRSTIKINISPNNGTPISMNDVQLYKLNLSKLENSVYSVMNNQLELTHNGKLQLRGDIDMPGGQKDVMMTTILYNKGWTAKVDGHKVKTEKAFNTFLAIHVPEGKHRIELSFWPPLLTLGIIVTLITWAILVLCWKYEKKNKK